MSISSRSETEGEMRRAWMYERFGVADWDMSEPDTDAVIVVPTDSIVFDADTVLKNAVVQRGTDEDRRAFGID